ncbi:MAG: hypothetical protein H0U81_11565 [Pyrinomonadaceae bacterium]|nr:hypothetical protein [Pyrinomonadaceae bacterium]
MKKDEMRPEYDFSKGMRGMFYKKVTGTREAEANGTKAATPKSPPKDKNLDEAVSLLLRVRPHLEAKGAQKIKQQIEEFLDRVVT